MYGDIYKNVSTAADEIIQGTYKPREPEVSSLISRPSKKQEVKDESKGNDEYLMDYLVAVRQQNQFLKETMKELRGGSTSEGSGYSAPPVAGDLQQALNGIASAETKGIKNPYAARGPVVESGQYKGERAVGKYQVMPGNIPSWTKEALGKELSVEEFLNSPEAQEAVAAHKLQQSYDKYGNWEDAASVWFTGRPVAKAKNASDGYHTNEEYLDKFRKGFG